MDFNDIEYRIKRIYTSIWDILCRNDVVNNMRSNQTDKVVSIGFWSPESIEETNRIMSVIHNIAMLKDHIKKDNDKNFIEDQISSSTYLKIIIDLANWDKHWYPLHKDRSWFQPKLSNIESYLTLAKKSENTVEQKSSNWAYSKNLTIKISAEIHDKNGKIICWLDEMLNWALNEREQIIRLI